MIPPPKKFPLVLDSLGNLWPSINKSLRRHFPVLCLLTNRGFFEASSVRRYLAVLLGNDLVDVFAAHSAAIASQTLGDFARAASQMELRDEKFASVLKSSDGKSKHIKNARSAFDWSSRHLELNKLRNEIRRESLVSEHEPTKVFYGPSFPRENIPCNHQSIVMMSLESMVDTSPNLLGCSWALSQAQMQRLRIRGARTMRNVIGDSYSRNIYVSSGSLFARRIFPEADVRLLPDTAKMFVFGHPLAGVDVVIGLSLLVPNLAICGLDFYISGYRYDRTYFPGETHPDIRALREGLAKHDIEENRRVLSAFSASGTVILDETLEKILGMTTRDYLLALGEALRQP